MGEKEPNDFKWKPLEELTKDDLETMTKNYKIDVDKAQETNVFIQRICSTLLIHNQTAISKAVMITKKVDKFLADVVKVINAIKDNL